MCWPSCSITWVITRKINCTVEIIACLLCSKATTGNIGNIVYCAMMFSICRLISNSSRHGCVIYETSASLTLSQHVSGLSDRNDSLLPPMSLCLSTSLPPSHSGFIFAFMSLCHCSICGHHNNKMSQGYDANTLHASLPYWLWTVFV